MRDIKFRAWDKRRAQMRDVLRVEWFQKPLPELGFVRMVPDEDTVFTETANSHCDVELMQYTGLHDKNGKEIYEGDIIKYRSKQLEYDAVFYEGSSFKVKQISKLTTRNLDHHLSKWQVTVIGNIHENPELLKENL